MKRYDEDENTWELKEQIEEDAQEAVEDFQGLTSETLRFSRNLKSKERFCYNSWAVNFNFCLTPQGLKKSSGVVFGGRRQKMSIYYGSVLPEIGSLFAE